MKTENDSNVHDNQKIKVITRDINLEVLQSMIKEGIEDQDQDIHHHLIQNQRKN